MRRLAFKPTPVALLALLLSAACGGDDTVTPLGDAGNDGNVTPDGAADTGTDGNPGDGATDGGLPKSFSHFFNGNVNAVVHAGTSWYVGGRFYGANVAPAPRLLPLDASGTPVGTCSLQSGFDGTVSAAIAVGSSIYVGGQFRRYQGKPADRLAKIDATTCALDTTFSPPNGNGFDATVAALATAGTSLYVGGAFTAYKGVANSANGIAKLDLTTGALDTTFSPANSNGFNNGVGALHVSGGSLYVGGAFSSYKGVANSANRLAKLDLTTGAIDTTFSPVGPTANGFGAVNNPPAVLALATSGGALYVGGDFTAYKGVASSANRLAKLDLVTGAIDTTFSPVGPTANGFDGQVSALGVSGTSLLVGGNFTSYRGAAGSAHAFAKLALVSGAQDATFVPAGNTVNGFERGVNAIAVSGTTTWVGGGFWTYAGYSANRIAKLDDVTYALDTTFSPANGNGFDADVAAILASGSSIYVGGAFTAYRGTANSAMRLAKLDATSGALDTTFSPPGQNANGFDAEVAAFATAGTSLYVGGRFTRYKGVNDSANFLAKLDLTTGALDTTFSPVGQNANGFDVDVFALTTSGTSLYVGGDFTRYKGVNASANRLAKLDLTTGAIDSTFSPAGQNANGFDAAVNALALSGNVLYVGGNFTRYKGVNSSANRLAKLDATTGALDATFSPVGQNANGFDAEVLALAVSGSSVYCGGAFNNYRGVNASANFLAKLDGTTGAIDTTFSPAGQLTNGFDGDVRALSAQQNALFAGGTFHVYRGSNYADSVAILALANGALQ